eukprot:Pgem_evm1s7792
MYFDRKQDIKKTGILAPKVAKLKKKGSGGAVFPNQPQYPNQTPPQYGVQPPNQPQYPNQTPPQYGVQPPNQLQQNCKTVTKPAAATEISQKCKHNIRWAKDEGLRKHAHWYSGSGLTSSSSDGDWHEWMHKNHPHQCPDEPAKPKTVKECVPIAINPPSSVNNGFQQLLPLQQVSPFQKVQPQLGQPLTRPSAYQQTPAFQAWQQQYQQLILQRQQPLNNNYNSYNVNANPIRQTAFIPNSGVTYPSRAPQTGNGIIYAPPPPSQTQPNYANYQ